MGVDVKNYAWHRDYHDKMMGNPAYQRYGFEVRGVLQTIRNLAGQTNNNGSIRVGGDTALSKDQLIDYLACTPGTTKRRIRVILDQLLHDNFLTSKRNGVIFITEWEEEQRAAPSYEAEKKRQQRERKQRDGNGEGAGEAPARFPSPAQVSVSVQERDMSPRGKGTCPYRTETEETENKSSVNLNPEHAETEEQGGKPRTGFSSGSVSEAGEGKRAGASCHQAVLRACELTEEFTPLAVNTYNLRRNELIEKYGDDLGPDLFDHGLNVLAGMIREKQIRTKPSAVLTGIMKKMLAGGHP